MLVHIADRFGRILYCVHTTQYRLLGLVLHYNACKSGVDNIDKLVGTFSCKRKINRWPMAVFFNMIDVAGVGALVIDLAVQQPGCVRRSKSPQIPGDTRRKAS